MQLNSLLLHLMLQKHNPITFTLYTLLCLWVWLSKPEHVFFFFFQSSCKLPNSVGERAEQNKMVTLHGVSPYGTSRLLHKSHRGGLLREMLKILWRHCCCSEEEARRGSVRWNSSGMPNRVFEYSSLCSIQKALCVVLRWGYRILCSGMFTCWLERSGGALQCGGMFKMLRKRSRMFPTLFWNVCV